MRVQSVLRRSVAEWRLRNERAWLPVGSHARPEPATGGKRRSNHHRHADFYFDKWLILIVIFNQLPGRSLLNLQYFSQRCTAVPRKIQDRADPFRILNSANPSRIHRSATNTHDLSIFRIVEEYSRGAVTARQIEPSSLPAPLTSNT